MWSDVRERENPVYTINLCFAIVIINLIMANNGSLVIQLLNLFFNAAGEPLPPELEDWYFEVVGNKKCLLIDAWGQTGEHT